MKSRALRITALFVLSIPASGYPSLDKLGKETACRALIEIDSVVYNIRPDEYSGYRVQSPSELPFEASIKYQEGIDRIGWRFKPVWQYKVSTGLAVSELEGKINSSHAKALKEAYTQITSESCTSQEDNPSLSSQNSSYDPAYNNHTPKFIDTYSAPRSSVIFCKGCSFDADYVYKNFDGRGSCLGLALDSKEFERNAPEIGNCLLEDATGRKTELSFRESLGWKTNHDSVLLESDKGEGYILKHIWVEAYKLKQNYPNTFEALHSIRQAGLEHTFLARIGKDLNVIPVTSETRIAFTRVFEHSDDGHPKEQLMFFKLTPYVKGSKSLLWLLKNKPLTDVQWHKVVTAMARYLARLHAPKESMPETVSGSASVEILRMHGNPSLNHWILDPENSEIVYLINWERYRDYGRVDYESNPVLDELSIVMNSMPPSDHKLFYEAYLDELDTAMASGNTKDEFLARLRSQLDGIASR
ncbi:MAG: hypothetical protein ACR2PT_16715 [Endozoicomonas sp.]